MANPHRTPEERLLKAKTEILNDLLSNPAFAEEKGIALDRARKDIQSFDPPLKFVLAGAEPWERKQHADVSKRITRFKHKAASERAEWRRNWAAREMLLLEHSRHQFERSLKETWRGKYIDHIASAKWRAFRKEVIALRGHKCEDCGASESLQVHHLTYERMGNEEYCDVRLLCAGCHNLRHQ